MCEDLQPPNNSSPSSRSEEFRPIHEQELARRLDQAKHLRDAGEFEKSRSILAAIFKPLLARPWAVELFMRLTESDLDVVQVDRLLDGWIRRSSRASSESSDSPQTDETERIVSVTLARLHWRQGYRAEALNMYRELLRSNPKDADLLQEYHGRLQEFHGKVGDLHGPLNILESWAAKIRLRKTELDKSTEGDTETG